MVHSLLEFLKRLRTYCALLATKLLSFPKLGQQTMKHSYQFICQSNPLFVQIIYFTLISFGGYAALKILMPQENPHALTNLDILFTSVSASTVSSMATIEIEDFSNSQLWMLTILMLIGGEVFTSMLSVYFMKTKCDATGSINKKDYSFYVDVESVYSENPSPNNTQENKMVPISEHQLEDKDHVEPETMKSLGYALMIYLLVTNLGGSLAIYLYLRLVPDAQEILKRKNIGYVLFSVFTTISSIGNCGFTPTNENMVIFQKNTILLLLIIPQIVSGNTLFAPFLRFMIWTLKKITRKKEYHFILQHPEAVGYKHLMNGRECVYLMVTVIMFIITQTILFCSLEWNSEALQEMNTYQKIVGALFQSVNARHAGESIVDLSSISSSILVLYTIMM
jgi:Trk-type K+ transport system membrane component